MKSALVRLVTGLAALALAQPTRAQPQPAPELTAGQIQSLSATGLTVVSQGKPIVFRIAPTVQVISSHRGTVADIKPGSFIGTTNTPIAAAAGRSTEVHVFPPGVKLGEGDRPMGPIPGAGGARPAGGNRMTNGTVRSSTASMAANRMTNGSVSRLAKGSNGLAFDVDYGNGVRHIVVPPSTPVMMMDRGSLSDLKPGMTVLIGAVRARDGARVATFINLPPPPPPHR